ncbi:MAG: diguanylate cyclase [Mycobacterium sp.]|nr:diguanylate cyclase [Mycobacterium sp.]
MTGDIVVVDDEPGTLKLLKTLLEMDGHEVRAFTSGALALRSIGVKTPDLVMLDIRMPGLSGFDVCAQLKADSDSAGVPVIFLSAATDIEDKVRAFAVGGVDYITKPFEKGEVLARVGTHISLFRALNEITRVTEALRTREESLRLAQRVAHVGHWEWVESSEGLVWSDEIYRILGIEPGSVRPSYQVLIDAAHPDDRPVLEAKLEAATQGHDFELDYRIVRTDGFIRAVHIATQHLAHPSGDRRAIGTIRAVSTVDWQPVLGVVQDITERKELELRLFEQANTDPLTGCANRRYFIDRAETEIARVRRYGGELSLLMLDVDRFKSINDSYGHLAGDVVLQKIGSALKSLLRTVDSPGRLGGDEFAVLLPETNLDAAILVADRIRDTVTGTPTIGPEGPIPPFTVSVGIASLADDSGVDAFMHRADRALYQAKSNGRDQVVGARE